MGYRFRLHGRKLPGRADAVLLIGPVVFVVEFKVGKQTFDRPAEEQVWDYALDLKNFHEASHAVASLLLSSTLAQSTVAALRLGETFTVQTRRTLWQHWTLARLLQPLECARTKRTLQLQLLFGLGKAALGVRIGECYFNSTFTRLIVPSNLKGRRS
jgi:hypothetical protein